MVVYPVCGTDVSTAKPYETGYLDDEWQRPQTDYQGKTYYFCCEECKERFEEHPDQYA